MSKFLIWGMLVFPYFLWGQTTLQGKISVLEGNEKVPIQWVDVRWMDTKIYTQTDVNGAFEIKYSSDHNALIISHLGYKTDTIQISKITNIDHTLTLNNTLNEVTLVQKKKDFYVSHAGVNLSEVLNKGELLKAACCNLSESFETNPSIDVTFTDAVTGIKQIQMLGLSSPYLQFNQENIPGIRGANQLYGFGFIPGTWVESIQISKGAGSVLNGYESISGQVNFELKKPETSDGAFLNLYASQNGRMEVNADYSHLIGKHLSTGIFIHGNSLQIKNDHNEDGFLDTPIGQQINVMNRWNYDDTHHNWHTSLILRYLKDERQAGQMDFNPDQHALTSIYWGSETDIEKMDTYFKIGKVFPDLPYKSMGFQANYSYHNQDSYYGLNTYKIKQNSLYFNYIYQSILTNTNHKFKTGLSFTRDLYKEYLNTTDYSRTDQSIGGFFEYNYDNGGKLSINAGLRGDHLNTWGFFVTPRLHLRYQIYEKTTLRASIGRGLRTANIWVENPQIFITNRSVDILNSGDGSYGLKPEIAWNTGINLLQTYRLGDRNGSITTEYYFTRFMNQVVVDFENARKVSIYNLDGKSVAHSFQVSLNQEIAKGLEMRIAFKNTFQKTDYLSGYLQKPLQAQQRYFVNLAYKTTLTEKNAQWHFDATLNHVGKMRIPDTSMNPSNFQLPTFSNGYFLMNAQINRNFSKNFSTYIGGENLLNTTQHHPILAHNSPFSSYFDGSMIYAPIDGSMIYIGLRYNITNSSR